MTAKRATRTRTNVEINPGKRLLSTREAATYLGVGLKKARDYCEKVGAVRRFGKSILFDRVIIDQALNRGEV